MNHKADIASTTKQIYATVKRVSMIFHIMGFFFDYVNILSPLRRSGENYITINFNA